MYIGLTLVVESYRRGARGAGPVKPPGALSATPPYHLPPHHPLLPRVLPEAVATQSSDRHTQVQRVASRATAACKPGLVRNLSPWCVRGASQTMTDAHGVGANTGAGRHAPQIHELITVHTGWCERLSRLP